MRVLDHHHKLPSRVYNSKFTGFFESLNMARSRPRHETQAAAKGNTTTGGNAAEDTSNEADAPPLKAKRTIKPPKLAEGMIDTDEAMGYGKKKAKAGKVTETTVEPLAVIHTNNNTAPPKPSSKPRPAKAVEKTPAKNDVKNESPMPPRPAFPGLRNYLAEREAQLAQASADHESKDEDWDDTREEIEGQITKRTAEMSDEISKLMKMSQETWLQAQLIADEFVAMAGYIGDEKDEDDARAKFDGVRKRKIRGERLSWPAAKRSKNGDAEK
jgi:restriction endonuclease Mrr